MRVPLDGGPASTLASGQSAPFTVALDTSFLYWTDYGNGLLGGAWRVALDGATPQELPSGSSIPFTLAVDSRAIYWTSPMGYGQSAIIRLAK